MSLKLSKLLLNLSLYIRYKSTYFEMKYYVKTAINNKERDKYIKVKQIYPYMRNIGKSYSLIKLALKYDIPIVTPTKSYSNNLKYMAIRDFKSDKLKTIVASEFNRGLKYDTVLIEEMIPDDLLNNVVYKISKNIVGYITYK